MKRSGDHQDSDDLANAIGEHLLAADRRVLDLLGISLAAIHRGHAVCQMVVRNDMVNSHEYCHGGLVFALADTAFAYACSSDNRATVTLSGHVVFSAAARKGDALTATAKVIKGGGRTGVCEVRVTNQHLGLVATYQGVCYRLNRPVIDA